MAKSWKERREEEARILAEMEEAMQAQAAEKEKKTDTEDGGGSTAQEKGQIHCAKCGTLMEKGVCPTCGHRIYVPMDENQQRTARLIIGAVCIIAFLLIYFVFNK